ncbi:NUDIX hydrolase [Microbacterium sp. MYb62]|uniref:NUDIX hydrolase n=1 Tax=Microbacterium sp. MYb62 TaxID=1848690 RepID=UPI0015E330EF|nr:NUDIX domain-containing protein [Microbacterium sp. MYb62]
MTSILEVDAHRLISTFVPRSERDRDAQSDFASFFGEDGGPVHRESGPDHLTASCVVFDDSLEHTLLVFHRKGQFWVQPGGHVEEGDDSVVSGALRELREETGIVVRPPLASPAYDLDHHGLSSRFGACASHLDIGIAVVVDRDSALLVSEESEDVRWWPVDALPTAVPPQLVPRLDGLLVQLRDSR